MIAHFVALRTFSTGRKRAVALTVTVFGIEIVEQSRLSSLL